jgi:SAM-dependent methyltransferase
MLQRLKIQLLDKWCVHLDGYTANRHRKVERLIAGGPIDSLNIGCGGGIETLKLLNKGNNVTLIEIDNSTAERAKKRVARNGYNERFELHLGHINEVDFGDRQFDQIMMCEVLEHVMDDERALTQICSWLKPGGRLLLSTPTCSFGQLPRDALSITEDGGHVRVGYEGPELDLMLKERGLLTIHRSYNGYAATQWYHLFERALRQRRLFKGIFGYGFSWITRYAVPILDLLKIEPSDQITLAVKLRQPN